MDNTGCFIVNKTEGRSEASVDLKFLFPFFIQEIQRILNML